MILLSKKEDELNKEEKLKLQIMKTLAVAKGYDLKGERFDLDFRDGSTFEKAARFLVAKFDISEKKKKEEKTVIKTKESPNDETIETSGEVKPKKTIKKTTKKTGTKK